MDLSLIQLECDNVFKNRWFEFGQSKLQLSFADYVCEEIRLSKNKTVNMSTDDLAFMISTKVLNDWSGIKDIDGNFVKYSQLSAFNALANDLNFLKLVVEVSLDRSKFV